MDQYKHGVTEIIQEIYLFAQSKRTLSEQMPSSSIVSANKEIQTILNDENLGSKRGQYAKYSDDERAKVAKRVSKMRITNSLQF